MASSSPSAPPRPTMASPAPSSTSVPTNLDANQPHQGHHQPHLRARLHALLQHTESHSGSSPALSPTSETGSHHLTNPDAFSSSTSLNSADHASPSSQKSNSSPLKCKASKGAISVLQNTTQPSPSASTSKAALATSPPLKLAALPRSLTTSNFDRVGARSPRSDSHSSGPSRASSLDPSRFSADRNAQPSTAAAQERQDESPIKQKRQRPSIKVRIITWNMHDSVPKGDLEVLLGKAGQYVPPDPDWDVSYDSAEEESDTDGQQKPRKGAHVVGQEDVPRADRIPPLPHDDSHPYHLLAIAGQECPWGDGKRLATSVGMAGELGDFGKQKNRAVKDKDKDKDASKDKDRAKPSRVKEKQRSGDSDSLPSAAADDSKITHSTVDETPAKGGANLPSDGNSFPFLSGPFSMALPGQPLASPWIGGSSMPGFSTPLNEAGTDDKSAVWPNIGGKGWSDLCEDWLVRNQTAKKDKDHKEKLFISGARLARALSQSTAKKDFTLSKGSLADHHHNTPMQSMSAGVTPELSRAASPIGIPMSASVPGTPNQSTFEGFNAFLDTPSQLPADPSASSASAEKRKRLVPKLNLNPIELVKKSAASGRSSPATFTGAECVASPVLLSPTALQPKNGHQLFQVTQAPAPAASHAQSSDHAGLPASTSAGGLLAVPGTPAMSRMSSSHSLYKLASAADPTSRSVSPAATEVHVEPPTPSRTPSPYPSTANGSGIPRDSASPAPPGVASISHEAAGANSKGNERAFADAIPKALGPYELVIKERMMGCYMAVYVWRGCKDRVRGASRSHVKSGLLAGRVGNKGGVGISLKLGTTRLLFVNAHLAAHEDKVALRLANVAKVKAALKVDSFLDSSDPRSRLEDITEQFDHTFWFGDLNFRIDISRQHADWLMMNKKYDQALAFDQLGKVLKEGDAFKGFEEAPINFPPTYKYDVLKTLKVKRNKTLTSIRNAVDIPGANITGAGSSSRPATADLGTTPLGESVIPEEGAVSFDAQAGDANMSYIGPTQLDVEDVSARSEAAHGISPNTVDSKVESSEGQDADRSDEDRFSISSSSAFGSVTSSSGLANNFHQTQEARLSQGVDPAFVREREIELQRQRQLAENTSAAQGPRFFSQGAAIKAKIKIMEMVRSATNSNLKDKLGNVVSSGNQHGGGKKKWLNVLTDSPRKAMMPASFSNDNNSIAESVSSMPSSAVEFSSSTPYTDEHSFTTGGRRGSLLSNDGALSSVDHGETAGFRSGWSIDDHTSSIDHESGSNASAPVLAGPRRSSLQFAKATALAAAKAQREAKYPHLTGATAEQIDFLEAQPYDTSAKQRVPSWCDRVLFRSTVPVDPEDDDDSDQAKIGKAETHETGLGSRVGSALSNALITPLRYAAERRHNMQAQRSTSSGLIAAVAGSSSIAFASEQSVVPEASLVDPVTRKGSTLRRERSNTTTAVPVPPALSSPRAETRTLAGVERTRAPHLLQRFLHPGRHRHHAKALSPSLTFSDLTHEPNKDNSWTIKNGSMDVFPTSASLGLGLGTGLGLAGLENKTISTVDLPSQVEERENRFDGAAKKLAASPVVGEVQARVIIPPRQSSAASSPVKPSNEPKPAIRSASFAAALHSNGASPLPTPPLPSRSVPALPAGPRRTFSSHSAYNPQPITDKVGWMDSLSHHLPSFFAPAISALRSHRHASIVGAHLEAEKKDEAEKEEEEIVGPKKGRIECLLYKSLDDREMRILEGRSDHRPVIFVGAIGI